MLKVIKSIGESKFIAIALAAEAVMQSVSKRKVVYRLSIFNGSQMYSTSY
jgi:hypothetical protein